MFYHICQNIVFIAVQFFEPDRQVTTVLWKLRSWF